MCVRDEIHTVKERGLFMTAMCNNDLKVYSTTCTCTNEYNLTLLVVISNISIYGHMYHKALYTHCKAKFHGQK